MTAENGNWYMVDKDGMATLCEDRAGLRAQLCDVRNELSSREAEIALLKKALMDAEAAPQPPAAVPTVTENAAMPPATSVPLDTLRWWRELAKINPQDLIPRIDAYLAAPKPPKEQP